MRLYDEKNGLYYESGPGGIEIKDADKKLTEAVIPADYDGTPVTSIGKKAFLGCKQLREVRLPESITSVGEWGFARCDALESLRMGSGDCVFGKGVFEKDALLTEIIVGDHEGSTSHLMAKAATVMEAEYLLDTEDAGSEGWFKSWDNKLSNILELADNEGYHLYVLCGEEDLHLDYDEYLEFSRRKKAGLCLLRLMYDEMLDPAFGQRLSRYVREHTVGCSSAAAWDHVLEHHADDTGYFELLVRLECIGRNNLEQALLSLGDRHAEAKGYLINTFNDTDTRDAFFEDLML